LIAALLLFTLPLLHVHAFALSEMQTAVRLLKQWPSFRRLA
jgi:hypothetical protein